MTTEVVLSGSIQAVGVSIAALIKSCRTSSMVAKAEIDALGERIREAKALARMQSNATLIRANLDELMATQRKIDSGALTGKLLEIALDNMHQLNEMNSRVIEGFGRG